jgi:uncharacterized protein (TIGR02466 family)
MLWDVPTDSNKLPVIIDLARKASTLRPNVARNWKTLARLLLSTGKNEEAVAALIEAISVLPTVPQFHLMLADAYYRAQRPDLVQQVLRGAPVVPIDDRAMTIFRLELLMKTLAVKEAAQIATDILALDPTNIVALITLGKVSRENGTPQIMIPVCQAALEHEPGHTCARYELAVAFATLGRSADARQLIDLDQFVSVTEMLTPEAYANAGEFEAALASEIARNPTLKLDPVGKATEGGFQTSSDLPSADDRAITVLLDLIRCAVDSFEADLAERLDHPFVQRRPKRAQLVAWAVVYPGDGRQIAHIHPEGWLSGVYYVSVPKVSSDTLRGGCLVMGSVELQRQNLDPPWGLRDIHPAPGRLLLFPSYVPHATVPTKSPDARICISFDVVSVRNDPALAD